MQLQLIRNATMKITYAGQTLLTDPMLSPKDAFEGFAGKARNPTIDLPLSIAEILMDVAALVVSHTHPDHFDAAAVAAIPKAIPVFCQPGDEAILAEHGFKKVTAIEGRSRWQGLSLTRTEGLHGKGAILEHMGQVSGFLLQAEKEPTVYWVGDSIWCDTVRAVIETHRPGVIITHSGGATLPGYDPIIMDGEQTLAAAQASPDAVVVAVHLEALDHCPVGRRELRRLADHAGMAPSRLLIPEDGEIVQLSRP